MNTRVCLGLALCGLLAGISSGCGSTPLIARGQSPLPDPFVQPASHGYQPDLHDVVHDSIHGTRVDHYSVPMNDPYHPVPVDWHSHHADGWGAHGACPPGSACPPDGACPPGGACPPSVECPYCHGHPANGQPCPFCQCEDPDGLGFGHGSHWHRHQYPQHRFTYAYKRPHNLVYPPPQVPGGAVVYPYYTLKGPSCFFRDDEPTVAVP